MTEFQGFPKIPRLNRPVVVTEKLDGCVTALTPITMADGSRKNIRDVEVGEYVLGVDDSGSLIPSQVLRQWKNGLTDKWLDVRGPRRGLGRGPSEFTVKVTPNHRFLIRDRGYIRADELKPGDSVLLVHNDLSLTSAQRSILLGVLLGDGSLVSTSGHGYSIQFSHSDKQEDYLKWTVAALGGLVRSSLDYRVSGYGSEMIRARTIQNPAIGEAFVGFDKPNGVIPEWVADKLDPLALAFWYMDDGSLIHHEDQEDRASFATNSFSEESLKILLRGLESLGLEASVQHSDKGPGIRLNADSADKMFLMIAAYVPPSMQYKLPERYRGSPGWVAKAPVDPFKTQTRWHQIGSINPWTPPGTGPRTQKYDLETETHNYFANRVLTHNSNAAVVIEEVPDEVSLTPADVPDTTRLVSIAGEMGGADYLVSAQSRKRLITPDNDNFGFAAWVWEHAADLVTVLGPGRHFGEYWGSGIQRGYGFTKGERMFSLFNTKRWDVLSEDSDDTPLGVLEDWTDVPGLRVVPTVAQLDAFDSDLINNAVDLLRKEGSFAVPGYNNPEGVVIYHKAGNHLYKVMLENDDTPKTALPGEWVSKGDLIGAVDHAVVAKAMETRAQHA